MCVLTLYTSFIICIAYSNTTIPEYQSGKIDCGNNNYTVDVYWARYGIGNCAGAVVSSVVKKLCDTQGKALNNGAISSFKHVDKNQTNNYTTE